MPRSDRNTDAKFTFFNFDMMNKHKVSWLELENIMSITYFYCI